MAGNSVNGGENEVRSGARTLVLLATPLNSLLLQALSAGVRRQSDLRRAVGSPAQTTLRSHLRELSGAGSIAKHRRNRFPGVLEFELTPAGRDLSTVAVTVERWLEQAPEGPLSLGTDAAKAVIKALTEGWSTTILRALAAGPLSLTELDRIIGSLSYPAIERRLGAMRLADQVEAHPGNDKGTPYSVTRWLRQGIAPLAAAIRWERRHLAGKAPPLTRIDTEAGFMLAAPLLQLPSDISGSCRMSVELADGDGLAGVMIDVEKGRIASCASCLYGSPNAWASGSVEAWLAALIDADNDALELGGDGHLARTFLDALHRSLFDGSGGGSRGAMTFDELIANDSGNQA